MFVTWKVELYQLQSNGTHSTTAINIDSAYDISFRTNIGDGKDSFQFKVKNFGNKYDDYFQIGDRVSIYRKVDSSTIASSDILVNGTITEIPIDEDSSRNHVVIKGNNYTETLMQALAFVSAEGLTIPQFFQQALNSVNANNPNFQVTWASSNPSTKQDGSAFPTVNETWNYKSILMLLEKYSSKKYTEDGNYYFYVNTDNELVWKPRNQTPVGSYSASTGYHKMIKVRRDKKGVVTFVIAKGQRTPSGLPISTFVQNSPAMAKHGFKPYLMISQANYVDNLTQLDRNTYPSSFDEGDTNPNTYNFTTAWNSLVTATSPTMTPGNPVTVSNDKEYNIAIRNQVKYLLKQDAQTIIDLNKNGKLQVQLDFSPGAVGWGLGDVITVTIPEAGKSNEFMRVAEVNYGQSTDSFVLEEDEGTV